jgi:hypothetical protein
MYALGQGFRTLTWPDPVIARALRHGAYVTYLPADESYSIPIFLYDCKPLCADRYVIRATTRGSDDKVTLGNPYALTALKSDVV